jgi:hypothetical protein
MRIALLAAVVSVAFPGGQVRTIRHVFSPWAGSIPARGLTIGKVLTGTCEFGSEVLTRFDAWHCLVGRRAYDPCFANTRAEVGAHVLCMDSPWETTATAIELTTRLPLGRSNPAGNPERFPPWAMVTAAGQECVLVTHSLGSIAGRKINYACAGSGFLLDLPTRGKTWTQQYANTIVGKASHGVELRSVWW